MTEKNSTTTRYSTYKETNSLFINMTQELINETFSGNNSDENLCFSPISLYYALSTLAFGCVGKTLDSLLAALGFEDVAGFVADMMERKERAIDRNTTWSSKEYEQIKFLTSVLANSSNEDDVNADAKRRAQNTLGSLVAAADFSNPDTAKMVREWCDKETDGFLSPDVNISDDETLFVASLFYYCGRWSDEFHERLTKNKSFHTTNGKVKVPFMRVDDARSYVFRGDGFTAASRTLGLCRMTFFLPNKGSSLEDVLCGEGKISHLLSVPKDEKAHIKWRVPKFDIASQVELRECCSALGIDDIFAPTGDIRWLKKGTPWTEQYLSDMKQDTRIAIDEEGCRAASFMDMHLRGAGLEPPRPVVKLTLDRPFAFALERPSELLVFGIVNDPSKN